MANNILDESKKWLPYFYINNTWIDKDIKIKFNGRQLNKEVVNFLNDLFHFYFESKMFNDCTILWLKSNASSMKECIEFYNNQVKVEDRLNVNTALSKIQYDRKKLERYFNVNEFINILAYPEKYLDSNREKLDKLSREYMKDGEYNKAMVLKIPKEPICKEVEDSTWYVLEDMIRSYSKKRIETIESGNDLIINSNVIGYYNYLISNKNLSKTDKDRLKHIREILGLES